MVKQSILNQFNKITNISLGSDFCIAFLEVKWVSCHFKIAEKVYFEILVHNDGAESIGLRNVILMDKYKMYQSFPSKFLQLDTCDKAHGTPLTSTKNEQLIAF